MLKKQIDFDLVEEEFEATGNSSKPRNTKGSKTRDTKPAKAKKATGKTRGKKTANKSRKKS